MLLLMVCRSDINTGASTLSLLQYLSYYLVSSQLSCGCRQFLRGRSRIPERGLHTLISFEAIGMDGKCCKHKLLGGCGAMPYRHFCFRFYPQKHHEGMTKSGVSILSTRKAEIMQSGNIHLI